MGRQSLSPLPKVSQLVSGRSGTGTQVGHPVPKYRPLYQVADTTCLFSGGSGHLLLGLWLCVGVGMAERAGGQEGGGTGRGARLLGAMLQPLRPPPGPVEGLGPGQGTEAPGGTSQSLASLRSPGSWR